MSRVTPDRLHLTGCSEPGPSPTSCLPEGLGSACLSLHPSPPAVGRGDSRPRWRASSVPAKRALESVVCSRDWRRDAHGCFSWR